MSALTPTPTELMQIIANYSKPRVYYGYSRLFVEDLRSVFVFDTFEKTLNKLCAVGIGEIRVINHTHPTKQQFKTNYDGGWLNINCLLKQRTVLTKWGKVIDINPKYKSRAMSLLKETFGNTLMVREGCLWD